MEKLLELLNEYEFYRLKKGNGIDLKGRWTGDSDYGIVWYGGTWGTLSELYAISREYGFIKWLVDNDKVDWTKISLAKLGFLEFKEYEDKYEYNTDMLLMLLSIQDNPIEFLISILR